MTAAAQTRPSLRFRGRSFLALVLAPEPPLPEWLVELDDWIHKSPGFFVGRPVVLDVAALPLDKDGLSALIAELGQRDVRIMGLEGAKSAIVGPGMPPLVSGGRQSDTVEVPDIAVRDVKSAPDGAKAAGAPQPASQAASLVVDSPVRSGQSVIFPQGDVTIIGSVASGAEVVAGGSIHIYGTLRGRAIAGSIGNPAARIFCGKLEAELLAIDGLYKTADTWDSDYRGRPVQTWLDGNAIRMTALS
ncbi:MAG: septum site-determining protein MinC [Rhizobiales bacterium]|nr:septum site-determining protein MinC [Hyphomicrobiales bacterium]MDQ3560413.1 septum site-determining protein MinC [Pseudomonadota bacterium]